MKSSLVRTFLAAVVVLAAALWGMSFHNATVEDYEYRLARSRLHNAFLERGAFVRSVAEADRYRDETAGLFKWFGAELSAVYNRFPTRRVEDAAMREMEDLVAKGRMKKEEMETRREWFDLTKHFYGLVVGGRYSPLHTGTSNGVRLDVARLARVDHDKHPALQLDLIVWGAPRRENVVKTEDLSTVRMTADFAIQALGLELVDAADQLVGGMDGGAPAMIVDHPERWSPDFPPQAWLATYWMDPLKAEAAQADFDLRAEIRSPSAGALPVSFHWRLPVKPEWRVREGEAFEGDERVMPEEMLNRGAAPPPDPKAKAGKGTKTAKAGRAKGK